MPAAGATNQMLTPTTEVVGILTVRKIKFEIGKPIMGIVYAALLARRCLALAPFASSPLLVEI